MEAIQVAPLAGLEPGTICGLSQEGRPAASLHQLAQRMER
jgi:hypothetical protein